jgi:cell division septation protein DedD
MTMTSDNPFDTSWSTHQWLTGRPRDFELESGDSVRQSHCVKCGRDFLTDLSSGSRHAVFVSVLSLCRLHEEITQRWLREPCPGNRLPADARDRGKRGAEFRISKELRGKDTGSCVQTDHRSTEGVHLGPAGTIPTQKTGLIQNILSRGAREDRLRSARFEIGPGGRFVILMGLLGLSAVFFLGTISERKMPQSDQGQNQLASVYQMPTSPPAASPSQATEPAEPPAAPVTAATLEPPSRAAVASENTPPTALPKLPRENKTQPHLVLASVPPAHRAAPGAIHHHVYKITIAAMDRASADRMVSRLLGLGYTSHIVPGQIDNQIWYRVQVGPYPTAAAAQAAQANLKTALSPARAAP